MQYKSISSSTSNGALDIKNWRIKKGKFKDSQDEYIYGLNIIGRRENQEFYSYKEADIDQWYDALIPFWVLLDLSSKYARLNKIGKGNFATVYKYERKSDK